MSGVRTITGLEGSVFLKTGTQSTRRWPDIHLQFFSASLPDDGTAEYMYNILQEVIYKNVRFEKNMKI